MPRRQARLHLYRSPDAGCADFKLVAMDMDSTLITIECIDEIADMQGLKPQVAEITEAAMRGEIEFRESLTRRVALLKGLDAARCSASMTNACAYRRVRKTCWPRSRPPD